MKKLMLLFFIFGFGLLFAQQKADSFTNHGGSNMPHDPRTDQMNFVPNEVIVKFKDQTPVVSGNHVMAIGISGVDRVLKAHGVSSLTRVFSSPQPQAARVIRTPQGVEMTIPRLDNIYRINVPAPSSPDSMPVNIFKVIDELKAQPEVEYAEPNYIYSIDAAQPEGPILTAEDVKKMQKTNPTSGSGVVVPNDPLYSQQWYIPAIHADSVWSQTMGDSTEVIAIVDTGVDWTHPDLANNIWTNPNPNKTPDANGVVNDIRGWDFINNDNNPMDDNSHGTHVAGIAAAQANNGIGIAGVCPKAKIMPIKVFQSSGYGDAATIAKGITYAATHGATVINMSFGSYARSLTMEAALKNAYATCVLVAAAGNDDIAIGFAPFFPAALPYVLGVQAPEASFSNYDQDGPVFSGYPDLLNYEMKAPGTNILSTIPNGNYRVYQGTSMAAPIVSGAVCLYKKEKSNDSQELMWGNLINTINGYINIKSAIGIIPKPQLAFVSQNIVDTLAGDNKNGIINAGETIQLWFTARNTWGQCDSVKVGIRFGEFEDTTVAQIITSKALIGSISSYATQTNQKTPFVIHISPKVANNRDIRFTAFLYYPNSKDTVFQNLTLNVCNGTELSGVMDSTLVLTPDKLWLIDQSFKVGSNGTLIIKPGTVIMDKILFYNNGNVIATGTKDSTIFFNGCLMDGPGNFTFKYTHFSGLGLFGQDRGNYYVDSCEFNGITLAAQSYWLFMMPNLHLTNCLVINCSTLDGLFGFNNGNGSFYIYKNSFTNCKTTSDGFDYMNNFGMLKYNNFNNISPYWMESSENAIFGINGNIDLQKQIGNSFIGMNSYDLGSSPPQGTDVSFAFHSIGGSDICNVGNQYWGTTNLDKIRNLDLYDFYKNASRPMIDVNPILTAPSDSCHAIVWKVLVNGKDAQDEVVDPVGVGKQRFDVYFNRSMDTTITPQVSFGVRPPYNQQPVNENGSWSADGKIYTVYKTISLTTGDGINRIRVAGAKEANGWNFEIPVENSRFNFIVNAAGSASMNFMATPGLGKVQLEWNNNKLADGLGYNMYRMTQLNDSTLSAPILINKSLITDTLYTDFSVVPNQKYFYYYKILRTNLAETDSSKVVSAIPFTASKGDANGDLSVNVLDITTIVAYLLNNNPQPFIFDAADVNSDKTINVLDVVGVVNLILHGTSKTSSIAMMPEANLYLQHDTLFADTNVPVGGIQFDLKDVTSSDEVQSLPALNGFESGRSLTGDTLRLLYYSMLGKTIPVGDRIPLLKLKDGDNILNAVFGDAIGSAIKVNYVSTGLPTTVADESDVIAELGQNYPNPFNQQTIIPVRINKPIDNAVVRIVNMVGQSVQIIPLSDPTVGNHLVNWVSGQNKGILIYQLEINQGKKHWVSSPKKMLVK